ncbi:Heterokaryon incompatibility protein (HET) domain containing protein [Rhypophila sp. PSN 637]
MNHGPPSSDCNITSQPFPPPEKDIFMTPGNETFYRGHRYQYLDPDRREIRLLRVHPVRLTISELASVFPAWPEGETDAAKLNLDDGGTLEESFICCELLERLSLDDITGKYSALSYCAGSALQTKRIMIDGHWFNAFANLEHALDGFRCHHDQEAPSGNLVWTDQACINQLDYPEKSHQVGFMRRIYESAANTYVVLSTLEAPMLDAREGIEAIRPALDYLQSQSIPPGGPPPRREVEGGEMGWDPLVFECLLGLIYNSPDHPVVRGLPRATKFMDALFDAKWWSRAWVFQEFVVSDKVYFVCGSECLALLDLQPFIIWCCVWGHYNPEYDDREHMRAMRLKSPMSSEINMITDAIKKSIIHSTHHLKHEIPGDFLTPRYTWRAWLSDPYQPEFLSHLARASSLGFKATDPRDMLYAFCGLSRITADVIADYSPENTIWKVYTDITEKFLEANKVWGGEEGPEPEQHGVDLLVLIFAPTNGKTELAKANLPSWAPDWADRRLWVISDRMERPVQRLPQIPDLHSHKLIQDVSRSQWKILVVDAVHVAPVGRQFHKAPAYNVFEVGEYLINTEGMVETGDGVWIIHGGMGMFVLRRREAAEGGYVLVGTGAVIRGRVSPSGEWVPAWMDELEDHDEPRVIEEWVAQHEGEVQRIEIF